MLFSHLINCPLLLLPSVFPSIRVFFRESALHIRWPKYWSFSFSISPSSEHSGLITFSLVSFGLISLLQRTLKSLLQPYSSKASILQCSAFFMVQLSHPYMTTGKMGQRGEKWRWGDWLEDFTTSWANEEDYLDKCTNNGVEEKWLCSGNTQEVKSAGYQFLFRWRVFLKKGDAKMTSTLIV